MTSKAVHSYILLAYLCFISGQVFKLPLSSNLQAKQSQGYHIDSLLNFTELAAKYGYNTEEHTAVTEDGYLLKIFRLHGKDCKVKGPPVVLMHGLLQSADVWLDAGPGAGLAYLLADACHDLWVGNQRGNFYSRAHLHLNPNKDSKFWQFSIDEIGLYDIPATVDYILKKTGAEKLNYIGFSQGSGTFFVMCSERPGYCNKANILISLSPATRQTHTKSVGFRILTETINSVRSSLRKSGVHELFSKGGTTQKLVENLCRFPTKTDVCGDLLTIVDSDHRGSITEETKQVLSGHFPAGTSVQNLARYGQSIKSRKFEKFDYGREENLKVYGSERPPEYNLSAVTVPVVVLYGRNDLVEDPKDVRWLVRKLRNVLEVEEVKDPLWNHLDVTYSRYVKKMIFPTISKYLRKYS